MRPRESVSTFVEERPILSLTETIGPRLTTFQHSNGEVRLDDAYPTASRENNLNSGPGCRPSAHTSICE